MLTDFVLMVVSLAGAKEIYDTGIYWAAVQGAVSLLLLVLTVMDAKDGGKRRGLMQPSAIVLLTVLLLELVNSCTGWWRGGICIKIVFTVLFVFHLVRAGGEEPAGFHQGGKAQGGTEKQPHSPCHEPDTDAFCI